MWKTTALGGAIVFALMIGVQAAEPADGEDAVIAGPFRATIGFSTGYDSNPEEEHFAEGSAFGRVDTGLRLSLGDEDATSLAVEVDAAAIDYAEDRFSSDYEYAIEAVGRHRLNDAIGLAVGMSHARDATDDPHTSETTGWLEAAIESDPLELALRGEAGGYKEFITREEVEADDLEIVDHRFAGGILRGRIDGMDAVTPLFDAGIRRIDYLERRAGKPERDAVETTLFAGVAIAPTDDLEIELGLRRNVRHFDGAILDEYAQTGLEASIEWTPADLVSLTLTYAQRLEEADSDEGLVIDARQVGAELAYEATETVTVAAIATRTREQGVAAAYDATVWTAGATVRWDVRDHLALLAQATAEHSVRHDDSSESYTRTIVRGGIEAAF